MAYGLSIAPSSMRGNSDLLQRQNSLQTTLWPLDGVSGKNWRPTGSAGVLSPNLQLARANMRFTTLAQANPKNQTPEPRQMVHHWKMPVQALVWVSIALVWVSIALLLLRILRRR